MGFRFQQQQQRNERAVHARTTLHDYCRQNLHFAEKHNFLIGEVVRTRSV